MAILLEKCKDTLEDGEAFQRNKLNGGRVFKDVHQYTKLTLDESHSDNVQQNLQVEDSDLAHLKERQPLVRHTQDNDNADLDQVPSVTLQSLLGQSRAAQTAHSTPALAVMPGVADRKAGTKLVLR